LLKQPFTKLVALLHKNKRKKAENLSG